MSEINQEADSIEEEITKLDKELDENIKKFVELRDNRPCFPLLGTKISFGLVNDVFDQLRKDYKQETGKLDVIIDSGGGDIHSAYNIALLFRKYGKDELNFFVPRWAKSAATLLACSGDNIYMSPIAELGPLDPQFTHIIEIEKRAEEFSPLHIESTLDLIRREYKEGNTQLADSLIERLQFPLTLGSFVKCIELSQDYLTKLLLSRMFIKNSNRDTISLDISKKFGTGYPDHSYCITVDEAKELGLEAKELNGKELDIIWEIYRIYDKKRKLKIKQREEKIKEKIKGLPIEELIKANGNKHVDESNVLDQIEDEVMDGGVK